MTVREDLVSWVHALGGAVRWAGAVVIALIAAIAVLAHHDTVAPAVASVSPLHLGEDASRSATDNGENGLPRQAEVGGRHAHEGRAMQIVQSMVTGVGGPACPGTTTQHCASTSPDAQMITPPMRAWASWSDSPRQAVADASNAAGAVTRAPPDLSLLSRLRI